METSLNYIQNQLIKDFCKTITSQVIFFLSNFHIYNQNIDISIEQIEISIEHKLHKGLLSG